MQGLATQSAREKKGRTQLFIILPLSCATALLINLTRAPHSPPAPPLNHPSYISLAVATRHRCGPGGQCKGYFRVQSSSTYFSSRQSPAVSPYICRTHMKACVSLEVETLGGAIVNQWEHFECTALEVFSSSSQHHHPLLTDGETEETICPMSLRRAGITAKSQIREISALEP